jgi:hypothetical protein
VLVRRPRRRQSDRFTVAVPIAVGRLIRQRAEASGITPSAAAARLLEEATRIDVEHQHSALIEATIERILHTKLERLDDLAARSAIQAYRGHWMLRRLMVLLGDRLPTEPSQAAQERISRLNTESHRKARTWLGEDGWAEPS